MRTRKGGEEKTYGSLSRNVMMQVYESQKCNQQTISSSGYSYAVGVNHAAATSQAVQVTSLLENLKPLFVKVPHQGLSQNRMGGWILPLWHSVSQTLYCVNQTLLDVIGMLYFLHISNTHLADKNTKLKISFSLELYTAKICTEPSFVARFSSAQ